MNPISLADLYRAKAERRARLAALPFDEKVRIMEELQTRGRTLRAARLRFRPSASEAVKEDRRF
ncbi:MAG: hypothetical protein WDN28_27230 [Chthoniobacter sp.]